MHALTQKFIDSLAQPHSALALFDVLPGVYFYAKDRHGRFMLANPAELELLGAASLAEVVGKSDADFFEQSVANLYAAEDRCVLAGETILNKRWMVPDRQGQMRWYLSSKMPLFGKPGEIVGLCGLLRELGHADGQVQAYGDLAPVIEHINAHYKRPLKVGALAALVGLSVSQLTRKFKAFSGLSPVAYILKVRLGAAQLQLIHSDRSIANIADDLGFYDQSYFTRQFSKETGLSPARFRKAKRV